MAVTTGRSGMRGFGHLEGAIMEKAWSAGRPLLVREIQRALRTQHCLLAGTARRAFPSPGPGIAGW